jgi:AraC-like DNA-binding protein
MFSDVEGGVLRLRDWAGLSCRPVYVYDRAYKVGGTVWEGEGTSPSAAWLVREGSVTVTTGRHKATARVGEWIVPSRGRHRCEFSADAAILSMRFNATWPDGRPLISAERGVVLKGVRVRELTRLAKRLERFATRNFTKADTGMEWKRADAVQYLALNRHFYAWLEVFLRLMAEEGCPPTTPARADERVLQAAHVLNTLPLAEEWNLEWLAKQAGLSVAQLNRLFVAAFETTPKAYHLERRKQAAAHLLRDKRVPVKQAALALGFSSACYFTAWFRTQLGEPPRRWLHSGAAERPTVR